jgi:hypothetical protein
MSAACDRRRQQRNAALFDRAHRYSASSGLCAGGRLFGLKDGEQVVARAGLNPGDQLILNPPVGVVDGMRVATTPEAKAKPIAGAPPADG